MTVSNFLVFVFQLLTDSDSEESSSDDSDIEGERVRSLYTCTALDQGLCMESTDKRVKIFIEQKIIHRAIVLIFIVTHNHNASVVLVL